MFFFLNNVFKQLRFICLHFYFIIVLIWFKRINVMFVNIIAGFNRILINVINILIFKIINITYLLFNILNECF